MASRLGRPHRALRGVDLLRAAARGGPGVNLAASRGSSSSPRDRLRRARCARSFTSPPRMSAGATTGVFGEQRPRPGPGVPQQLRALQARGRAPAGRRRRAAARDRATEHRRRPQRQRLDLGVQRPLLADPRGRAWSARGGPREAQLDRRFRAGRLRDGRPPRAARGADCRTAPTTSLRASTR